MTVVGWDCSTALAVTVIGLDCFASLAMTEEVVERTEGVAAVAFCVVTGLVGRISPKRITLGILVALSPILR